MARYELLHVFVVVTVGVVFVEIIDQQIVAYPRSDKCFLDGRVGVYLAVQLRHGLVRGVKVRADNRVNAAWTLATGADRLIFALHLVHVRRRPAQIRNIPFKFGVLCNFIDLFQHRLLAPRRHKLALVRRNRAETASTKTAPVHVDRELNHLVGGYRSPFFVFWVG